MSDTPALSPPEEALLDHAPFTPFMTARTAHPPGLSPLEDRGLTLVMPDFAAQMARREALLAVRPEVCLAIEPGAAVRRAADELLEIVSADAARPPGFRLDGDVWHRPDGGQVRLDRAAPFATLGRMVAEDWCLLLPDPASGEYRLAGAVLCFPAGWSLSEKLGRPMTAIHDPVPVYDDTLARRVNRVFEALRPGRAVFRVNWLVYATCEPHLPRSQAERLVEAAPTGGPFFLRTERQTLSRLPVSGGVAFGIKTSICPLAALSPAERAGLARELSATDPGTMAYRGGPGAYRTMLASLAALDSAGGAGHSAAT